MSATGRILTSSADISKVRVHARHGLATTMHKISCFMTIQMLLKLNTELREIITQHFKDFREPSRADSAGTCSQEACPSVNAEVNPMCHATSPLMYRATSFLSHSTTAANGCSCCGLEHLLAS